MKKLHDQRGFSVIEAVLIVVIIAIVGFVGWYVWSMNKDSSETKTNSSTSQTSSESSENPPAVDNSDDLKEAEDFVNNTDVDKSLDTTELDSAVEE